MYNINTNNTIIIYFSGPLLHATAIQYGTCFVPFGTGWFAYKCNYHVGVALWRIILISSFTISNGKAFSQQKIFFLVKYYIFNSLCLFLQFIYIYAIKYTFI